MICPRCGENNFDSAKFCGVCGTLFPKAEPAQVREIAVQDKSENDVSRVNSHLTAAILCAVFLLNAIFGIPAIVFASESEKAKQCGEYDNAVRFSRRAMTFISATVISSLTVIAILVFIGVCVAISGR